MSREDACMIRDIGHRVELFVDEWLIEEKKHVDLRLHPPVKREVVLQRSEPWEDTSIGYYTVFQDGDRVRLYYRGYNGKGEGAKDALTCYAESADGVHFAKPNLGLVEWNGTRENNIIWKGVEAHNVAPFRDTNPNARPEEQYKALGFSEKDADGRRGLRGLCSPDGLQWKRMKDEAVITQGAFDSLNVAFWDEVEGRYRCFSRFFEQTEICSARAIQSCSSEDFIHWTEPQPHRYRPGLPREHFYTNATVPCPGAPHIYLSFPKRFEHRRKKLHAHPVNGISDAGFMTSRDGVHWDRAFREAWVRPGLDQKNWGDRSNMPAWGILELNNEEFSMYISEHTRFEDTRLRRLTLRKHGFASAHAGADGGEFTTRPLRFTGSQLHMNYSTSAFGFIQVEVQDMMGGPLPGCSLEEMPPLFGDELDRTVTWWPRPYLAEYVGKPVRFRFVMADADLFSIQVR